MPNSWGGRGNWGRNEPSFSVTKKRWFIPIVEALEDRTLLSAPGPLVLSMTPLDQTFDHVDVRFNEAIDANSFDRTDVTIVGPSGPVGATNVNALTGDTFRILFNPLTVPGSYQVVIGPNISDLAGNLMDQNQNGINGEATADQFKGSFVYIVADKVFTTATPSTAKTITESDMEYDGKNLLIVGTTVVIDGLHQFNSIQIVHGGKIAHDANTATLTHQLSLTVTDQVIVDASSSIDVTGKGYLKSYTTGNKIGGATNNSGGSYGGLGGAGHAFGPKDIGVPGGVYGDYADPQDWGSGGVSGYAQNGDPTALAGGGLVRLTAAALRLDGQIRADGNSGPRNADDPRGGGSGGGVFINAETISGSGLISAVGGNGDSFNNNGTEGGGGGGGGRIAVYARDISGFDVSRIYANGGQGNGGADGGAGTVYLQDSAAHTGKLIVDSQGRSGVTPLSLGDADLTGPLSSVTLRGTGLHVTLVHTSPSLTISTPLTVTGGAELRVDHTTFAGAVTIDSGAFVNADMVTWSDVTVKNNATLVTDERQDMANLSLASGAVLTTSVATPTSLHLVDLHVSGTASIDASSSIDVTGKGYLAYYTTGNNLGSATLNSGGSYGGQGGAGHGLGPQDIGVPNAAYGDPADPEDWGGGGVSGYAQDPASLAGGGLVRITAGALKLDGQISADGNSGPRAFDNPRGGGSGGGIYINAQTISGSGLISAVGGNGDSFNNNGTEGGGGGGGGRIAVYSRDFTGFDLGHIFSNGGHGNHGADGMPTTPFILKGVPYTHARWPVPTGINGGYLNQAIGDHVDLYFNHPIDMTSFDPAAFLVDGQMGPATATKITQVGDRLYRIDLSRALTEDGPYHFALPTTLRDTAGYLLDQNENGIPGEPGDAYSFDLIVDTVAPHITHQTPAGDVSGTVSSVDVWFSESIDKNTVTARDISIIGPDLQAIAVSDIQEIGLNRLRITFAAQTQLRVYHVKIAPNITDLAGNPVKDVYDGTFNVVAVDLGLNNLVVAPNQLVAGESATISWSGSNLTGAPLIGDWTDGAYLSADNQWDINDLLLTTVHHTGGLDRNQSYSQSVTVPIPGVLPGNYYVLVKADVFNQEKEGAGVANNQIASPVLPLTIHDLPTTGVLTNGTLALTDRADYYRIQVAEGQHLHLFIQNADVRNRSEVYVRFGQVPTRYQFDYQTTFDTAGNPTVDVPATLAGAYYVMVYGKDLPNPPANYSITASLLNLGILDVAPSVVGNKGDVTLRIHGVQIPLGITPVLVAPSGKRYTARTVYRTGPDLIYPTFDLSGSETGLYDVLLEGSTAPTAALHGGLKVGTGQGPQLEAWLTAPASVNQHGRMEFANVFDLTVNYANLGDTDVAAPLLVVSTTDGSELEFNSRSVHDGALQLLGVSADGPAGILRPGETGKIIVGSQLGTPVVDYFLKVLTDDPDLVPWADVKASMRPDYISATDWDKVWPLLIANVGGTWSAYRATLARDATLLPQESGNNADAVDLMQLEIQRAYAATGTSISGFGVASEPGINMAGRQVTAHNLDTDEVFTTVSTNDGSFVFPRVSAGHYAFSFYGAIIGSSNSATVADKQSLTGVQLGLVRGGEFTGYVLDRGTGQSIAAASIEAVDDQGRRFAGTSGPDGRYSLEGLPQGSYTLTAQAGTWSRSTVANLSINRNTIPQDVILMPESTIDGTVVLAPGGPTGGTIRVVASSTGTPDLLGPFFGTVQGQSFHVGNLSAGTYAVEVTLDGYLPNTIAVVVPSAGKAINIGTINLQRSASIAGVASTTHPVGPATGVTVGAFIGTTQAATAFTDTNGTFAFSSLAPGTYVLRVVGLPNDEFGPDVQVTVANGDAVTGIGLHVLPGASITGIVSNATTSAPMGFAPVTATGPNGESLHAATDANGVYRFDGLGLGAYRVALPTSGATASQLVSVASIDGAVYSANLGFVSAASIHRRLTLSNGTAATDGTVDLFQGGAEISSAMADANGNYWFALAGGGTFELRAHASGATFNVISALSVPSGGDVAADMTAGTGSLEVDVTDIAGAVDGARVFLSRPTPAGEEFLDVQAVAPTGIARFTNLASGTYEIEVQGNNNRGVATTTTIVQGSATTLPVQLEQRFRLTGLVVDSSGNPVISASVVLDSTSMPTLRTIAVTDSAGKYEIDYLPLGNYRLVTSARGYQAEIANNVAITQDVQTNITLVTALARFSGRVVDSTGRVIAAASIAVLDAAGNVIGYGTSDTDGQFNVDAALSKGLHLQIASRGFGLIQAGPFDGVSGVTAIGDLSMSAVGFGRDPLPGFPSVPLSPVDAPVWIAQYVLFFQRRNDEVRDPGEPPKIPVDPCGQFQPCMAEYKAVLAAIELQDKAYSFAVERKVALDKAVLNAIPVWVKDEGKIVVNVGKIAGGAAALLGAAPEFAIGLGIVELLSDVDDLVQSVNKANTAGSTTKARADLDLAFHAALLGPTIGHTIIEILIAEQGKLLERISGLIGIVTGLEYVLLHMGDDIKEMEDQCSKVLDAFDIFLAAKRIYDAAVEQANSRLKAYEECLKKAQDDAKVPRISSSAGNGSVQTKVLRACDPNGKVGPTGFGDESFIASTGQMPFQVFFENDPELATAPAQEIVIHDALDQNLDLGTFQLTQLSFAKHTINVPPGVSYYKTNVDLRPEGIPAVVEVEAGLNVETREFAASFVAVDPSTGWLPDDPLVGLLYPNDGTGRGAGSISYVVSPKAGLPSGTVIDNRATITFDYNDPIDTPLVQNTLDAVAPTSHVLALPATEAIGTFTVQWAGQDEPGGSGVASYNVYVSVDGAPYTLLVGGTTNTSAVVTGQPGHTYAFYSVATDNVGHVEATPTAAQATTTVTVEGVTAPVITWATAPDITYGTALSPADLDAAANVPGTFSYSPAAGTVLQAGQGETLTVTFTPTDTAHYSAVTASTTINVKPATLTVTGITASSKVYDGSPNAILNTTSASLVSVLSGDTVTLATTGSTGTFASKDVGNNVTVAVSGLTLSGPQAADYTVVQPATTANITPATLTATFTVEDKIYDGTTLASVHVTPLPNIDGSGATGTFSTKDVGNAITVTVSGVKVVGPNSGDYTLTVPPGSANITPAALTVIGITANDKAYDGTTTATLHTSSAALVGVIGGDVVTLGTAGATGTFASKDVGNGITVTVSGLTLGGPQAGDYTLIQPITTANITPSAVNNTPPVVLGVSPNAGPAPGTVVQISGTGFQPGSRVLFGGVPATISGSPTATNLSVVVPALQVGTADVTVVNPDGQQAVLRGAFFALPANPPAAPPPLVASVSPSAGQAPGGAVVNVFGSGFQSGSKVFFDGVPATISGSLTATLLTVVVPTLPLGPADVMVVNPDGQQTVLAGAYFALPAPPPVLGGLSVNAGTAPGAVVQIFGTGFQPGSQVFIGGVLATLTGTPTAITLTVVVPALPLGSADVKIVNPDGQEAVLTGAFFAMPGAFFGLPAS